MGEEEKKCVKRSLELVKELYSLNAAISQAIENGVYAEGDYLPCFDAIDEILEELEMIQNRMDC